MALQLLNTVRRDQILSNSLDMVREGGFAALSLPGIAARCDCGLSTIKRHFRNREVLCRALVSYAEMQGDGKTVETGRRLFPA